MVPVIFLVVKFLPILWKKGIFGHKFSVILRKKIAKKIIKKSSWPKIVTTAYNMKGCLSFFYFHILKIVKYG